MRAYRLASLFDLCPLELYCPRRFQSSFCPPCITAPLLLESGNAFTFSGKCRQPKSEYIKMYVILQITNTAHACGQPEAECNTRPHLRTTGIAYPRAGDLVGIVDVGTHARTHWCIACAIDYWSMSWSKLKWWMCVPALETTPTNPSGHITATAKRHWRNLPLTWYHAKPTAQGAHDETTRRRQSQ